mmetsp:Transcript_32848/g.106084  ORF Transcript_32848/g.106084 Transcript_32848/m.106084 type:complete len:367 (-) Transcript_32848:188-1288(-)
MIATALTVAGLVLSCGGGQQQQQHPAAAEGADGKAGACERQNQQRWQLPDREGGDRERPRGELDLLAEAQDEEHVDGAERDKHEEGDVGGIRLRREVALLAVPHVRLHRLLPRPQPPAEHAVRCGEAEESDPNHQTGEEADEQQPGEANEERHRRAASQDRPRDRQVLHRHVRQRGDQPPQLVHVLRREALAAVAAAALEPFIRGGGIVGVAAGADGGAEDGDGSDDVRHGGEGRVLLRETHLQHPSRRVRREAHVAVLQRVGTGGGRRSARAQKVGVAVGDALGEVAAPVGALWRRAGGVLPGADPGAWPVDGVQIRVGVVAGALVEADGDGRKSAQLARGQGEVEDTAGRVVAHASPHSRGGRP